MWTSFSSVLICLKVPSSLSFIFFFFLISVLTDCSSDHGFHFQSFSYISYLAVSKSHTHTTIVPLYAFFSIYFHPLLLEAHTGCGWRRESWVSPFLFPCELLDKSTVGSYLLGSKFYLELDLFCLSDFLFMNWIFSPFLIPWISAQNWWIPIWVFSQFFGTFFHFFFCFL